MKIGKRLGPGHRRKHWTGLPLPRVSFMGRAEALFFCPLLPTPSPSLPLFPSCDWATTTSIAGGQALPRRPPWLPAAMAGCSPRILVLQPSPRTASTAVEKSFNHRQKSFNGTAQQGEAATAVGFCYYCRSFLLHPSGGAATSRRRQRRFLLQP